MGIDDMEAGEGAGQPRQPPGERAAQRRRGARTDRIGRIGAALGRHHDHPDVAAGAFDGGVVGGDHANPGDAGKFGKGQALEVPAARSA